MRALLFDGVLRLVADYPRPRPGLKEALVRVLLAGICATDLEITRGYGQFRGVLGHEFVGVVEEVNGGRQDLVGRRVVGEINIGCGRCDYCRRGLAVHCPARRVLGILNKDGCFADYFTLPVGNLHPVPDQVADEEAVFVEPLAAAFRIPEQVLFQPADRVLVMGDGKLGLLIAQVLHQAGVRPLLLGHHPEKLALAARLGIETALAADLPSESLFDLVVESTGSTTGFRMALELVRPEGTLVLKSTVARPQPLDWTPVVVKEITVIGSRCGPFPPAIRALAAGRIQVRPLVARVCSADRAMEGFAGAVAKGTLKVLLDFRPC